MSSCPRYLAINILCQWQQSEQPIDALLDAHLQEIADGRDRNLLKSLVFGALRERGTIDWLLERLSTTPLHRLKLPVLQALRLGAYQILFLDRVPLAAAIHSTVEAVKQMKQPRWLTGFVNGILRNMGRRRQEFLEEIQAGKAMGAARFNHPDWLLERWQGRYGSEGMALLCQSNAQPARLCLRVNTRRVTVNEYLRVLAAKAIHAEAGHYASEAIWLDDGVSISDLPGYGQGWFFVQDEFAQLIGGLILPCPAGNLLDGCAGLGGKTSVLAEIAPEGAHVIAVEPHPHRQKLFRENMARLGLDDVILAAGTLAEYAATGPGSFAAVLIDAPCSGLGVTGRHPDIRWQRNACDLPVLQAKQLAIMAEAAPLVGAGGILVYATCSTEPEENEAVIDLFLSDFPQFVVENAAASLPPEADGLVDERGFLRTVPGRHGSDGFFAARLKKVC